MRRKIALLALPLVAGALLSCATDAPDAEPSVRPGINEPYRARPLVEEWADRFEVESREIFARRVEILDRLLLVPGMEVADVGAGTGFLTVMIARRVGSGGTVYATDIIPRFVEHIGRRAEAEGLPNVVPVVAPDDDVGLPPASIDLAFLCDVYHHLEHPRRFLASLRRALRPGGSLVVVDFIREEGRSRAWVLDHVRAGREVVAREIEDAGFRETGEERFLAENYFLRFVRE